MLLVYFDNVINVCKISPLISKRINKSKINLNIATYKVLKVVHHLYPMSLVPSEATLKWCQSMNTCGTYPSMLEPYLHSLT